MPDVFAAILILSLSILLFGKPTTVIEISFILFVLFLSIAVHNSNFYIGMLVLFVLLFAKTAKFAKRYLLELKITTRKIFLLIFFLLGSHLCVGVVHYFYGGKFVASRGGVVFLFSNLIEMGLVDIYLEEHCGEKEYAICSFRESLPNNFLWDEKSPIQNGGWGRHSPEYTAIIKDMLSKPTYLGRFIYKCSIYTIKQFLNFDITDVSPAGGRVTTAIQYHFPNEYNQLENSKENKNLLNLNILNFMQLMLFGIFSILYFYYLSFNKLHNNYALLFVFILLALLINAAICSIFSGVFPRYQTRVVWLYFMPMILYFIDSEPTQGFLISESRFRGLP